jgi:hypothetical protein
VRLAGRAQPPLNLRQLSRELVDHGARRLLLVLGLVDGRPDLGRRRLVEIDLGRRRLVEIIDRRLAERRAKGAARARSGRAARARAGHAVVHARALTSSNAALGPAQPESTPHSGVPRAANGEASAPSRRWRGARRVRSSLSSWSTRPRLPPLGVAAPSSRSGASAGCAAADADGRSCCGSCCASGSGCCCCASSCSASACTTTWI